MPASVRALRLAGSALALGSAMSVALPAQAQQLYLPQPPRGVGGEDSIETSSGARCRQSMNGNGAYLDMGVIGATNNSQDPYVGPQSWQVRGQEDQAVGYVRFTMPLGKKPRRIDCTRLYEMELERLEREIELLRMAAE